jgi:hypothetical protein
MRVVQFQTVISFQNVQQSRSFGTSFKFPEGSGAPGGSSTKSSRLDHADEGFVSFTFKSVCSVARPNSEKSNILFLNRFVTYLRTNILKALNLAHLLKHFS